jgi:hypothetical protein
LWLVHRRGENSTPSAPSNPFSCESLACGKGRALLRDFVFNLAGRKRDVTFPA